MNPITILFLFPFLGRPLAWTSEHCPGIMTDYQYLDFHLLEQGGKQNPDRIGDFDFCLPESRTLLRHSLVPKMNGTQQWELFVRSKDYRRLGSASVILDQGRYRLTCVNGSYLLFSHGEVSKSPNWTEVQQGGGSHTFTDTSSPPTQNLIFGFQCTRLVPPPSRPLIQGICLRRFCCLWDLGPTEDWRGSDYLEGWYHPILPSDPPVWDHTGPLRCGGIAKTASLLNTTDPLHPVGTAPRRLAADSSIPEPDFLSSWDQNSFIQLLGKVAKETEYPNCWICAHAPSHLRQGLPLVPFAVTLEQLRLGNVASWNLTALNLTHQYLYLTGPTHGPLCRVFSGDGASVGTSSCDTSLEIHENGQVTVRTQSKSHLVTDLPSAWALAVGANPVDQTSRPNIAFLHSFASGRLGTDLAGLWWICAHRAYRWVSPHMSGSCYLGYIVPGVRVTQDLPTGRLRNKREEQALSDLSDVAANGETWGRALFPAYGAGSNHVDILRLTDVLLKFMREAEQITDSLTTELSQVRQLGIQNRIATDFLLSAEGGTCALIGSECCTYVTDQTLNITGHLNNIHRLTSTLHDIQHEGMSDFDLWSWLPNLGWAKQLLKGIFLVIIVIVLCMLVLCCISRCWTPCCSLIRCPLTPPSSSMFPLRAYYHGQPTFPEYVQLRHLGEGEYQVTEV